MKTENKYENENINLFECFDFTEDVPKSFENECKKYWLDKWKEICKPQFLPDCFYLKDNDGKLYFVHRYIRISRLHISSQSPLLLLGAY